MGHKPIVSPDTDDVSIQPRRPRSFTRCSTNPAGDGSPGKVRAYLSAHAHEWKYYPSLPLKDGAAGKIPQIVAGNAGSPPDKNWRGTMRISATRSSPSRAAARCTVQSYGRKIPVPYYTARLPRRRRRARRTSIYSPSAKPQ
jgi:hypothetical protein